MMMEEEDEYNMDELMLTREKETTPPVMKKEAYSSASSTSTSALLLRRAVDPQQIHPVYPEYDNLSTTATTTSTLISSLISSLFLSPPNAAAASSSSSFDNGVVGTGDKKLLMRLRLLQEEPNSDKGVAQTAKEFLGNHNNVDQQQQEGENPIPQTKRGDLKINTTTESITLLGAIAGLAAVSVIFIIIMIYICYRKCGSKKDGNNNSSKGSGGSNNNKYNNDSDELYDHQQRHRNTNYYDDVNMEGRNGKNSMNTNRRDRRRGTNNNNNIRDKNSRLHSPNHNGRILLQQHQHQPRPPVSVINVDNSDNNTIDDSTLGCDTAGRQPAVPVTNVITRSQMTLISDLGDSVVPPPSSHHPQSRKVSPRTLQQHQQQYLHRQLQQQQQQQQQQVLPQSYLNLDPMHTYSIAQNMHHRHNNTTTNNTGNSANILFENRKYHERMKMQQQMQNYSQHEDRREQHNHHHHHAVHAVSPEPNHPTTHHPFYNTDRNKNHSNPHINDNDKEEGYVDNDERKNNRNKPTTQTQITKNNNNNKASTPSPNKSVDTTSSSSTGGEEQEEATTPSLNDLSLSLNSDSFITLLRDDSARLGLHADLEEDLHTPSMYSPVSTNVRMKRQQQQENEEDRGEEQQQNNNNNNNRLVNDHTKNNNLQGTFEIKNGKIIASTGTLLSSSSSSEGEEEQEEDNNIVPPPFPPRQLQQLDKQKRNSQQLMSRIEGYNSYNYNTSQSSLVDSLALSATTDDEENFSSLVKGDLQHDVTTARGIRTKYALSNNNNTRPKYQHYISESSLDSTPDYGEVSSQSDGGGGVGYPPRTIRKSNNDKNKSKAISKPNIVSPQTSTTEDPSSTSAGTSPGTSPSGSGGDEQQAHHHHDHSMSLHNNMMKHPYAAATTGATATRSIDLSSDSSSADLDKHTHNRKSTIATNNNTNNNGLTTINGESPLLPQQIRRKYQTLASPRNRRFNKRLHSSGSAGVGVGVAGVGSLQSSQLSLPSSTSADSSGGPNNSGITSSLDIIRPISNPWSFEATSSEDDTDYEQDENGELRRGGRKIIPIPKESLLGKSPYEEDGTTSDDEDDDEEEKFLAQQQQESHNKSNSKKYLRVSSSSAGLGLDGLLPQPPQDEYSPYESDDDKSNNENDDDDIIHNNNIHNKIKNHTNNKMEVSKVVSLEEQLSILESSQHNPHNSNSNSNLPPAVPPPPPISLSTPSPLSDRKRIPSITSTSSNSTTRMNHNQHNQQHPHPISRSNSSDGSRGSSTFNTNSSNAISQRRIQLIAPPGKLGIVLLPRSGPKKRGTYVSDVKTYSSLYGKLNKGDRIVKIDNVNVSRMSVEEFIQVFQGDTSKSQSSRVLTVVTSMKDDSSGGVSQLTDV